MDLKKIATSIFTVIDKNYPIPNQLYSLIVSDITRELKKQLIEQTQDINQKTDQLISDSTICTEEKIIGLAYEEVLLVLGLRN